MIARDALAEYLTNYLAVNIIKDYCINGLQVQGNPAIRSIITAVTASQDAIDFAAKHNAQALIVHHGYCWNNDNPTICGMQHARISTLIKNDINLFAYHLPLDLHKTLGNNILLAKKLALKNIAFCEALKTPELLCTGFFEAPVDILQLENIITELMQRTPSILNKNNKKLLNKIAICTGAAADAIYAAKANGVDAFITGELTERTYYQALELDLVVVGAGHHATERFGVQALGAHLAQQFSLEHQFYDSHNPI